MKTERREFIMHGTLLGQVKKTSKRRSYELMRSTKHASPRKLIFSMVVANNATKTRPYFVK